MTRKRLVRAARRADHPGRPGARHRPLRRLEPHRPAPTVAPPGALYAPGGSTGEAGEVSIAKVEAFWQSRLTYPTGRLDPAWLASAAQQAKAHPGGDPARDVSARPPGSADAQTRPLDQGALCREAPRPAAAAEHRLPGRRCFTFGHVSGRVNAIAYRPRRTRASPIWRTSAAASGRPRPAARLPPRGRHDGRPAVSDDRRSTTSSSTRTTHNTSTRPRATSTSAPSRWAARACSRAPTPAPPGPWRARTSSARYPQPAGAFPQYQAVGKVQGRPEHQQQCRRGHEDRRLLLARRRGDLAGPLPPRNLQHTAPGRDRPDPQR